MKTYSESIGQPNFNWFEFLSKESFTDEELEKACDLSSSWVTCACGNQCVVIPRNYDGSPKDAMLLVYGLSFSEAIKKITPYFSLYYTGEAIKILKLIEERSKELIVETEI